AFPLHAGLSLSSAFCFPPAVRQCPMPPMVHNGNHNGQGKAFFTTGTVVTYTCDPGYYLVGNADVFCTLSGKWSQPGPRCEVRQCPMPPMVHNGNHNGQGKAFFTTGTVVTYTCDPGYYLVGNADVFCTLSGKWSQPGPRCEGAS
ncbi:C4BPA protein, partial [Aramus guarauna]|nr:C4BPA protein [Aramus guarauna]